MMFAFSRNRYLATVGFCLFSVFLPRESEAQPTIRVDKTYEDTVRIMVLFNETAIGAGFCPTGTNPVGPLTRNFVNTSLTGIPLTNIIVSPTRGTTWSAVTQRSAARWGAGKLPHVIVHLNAGWHSENGPDLPSVLNTAAAQRIGVVSIGDDAAAFADEVFGFTNVQNVPPPMNDATQFTSPSSKLWLALDGKADTLPTPGVIRNTAESLMVSSLEFKPFAIDGSGQYRCQADADKYTVLPSFMDKLSFLGFQRAFNGSDTVGAPREFQTIVAFQDGIRRGVALSFQPQFLKNAVAAHQIVYDAILYASFAHQFNVTANLFFTDENGVRLGSNVVWSPAKGKLYLTYLDDHRPNLEKVLNLSIRNRKGLAPSDSEAVNLRVTAVDSGRGIWKYEVALDEAYVPTRLNGIAETYFLGEVTATMRTHSFNGLPDGNTLRADLRVAREDAPESVNILDATNPALSITRFTTGIIIEARDQSFSDLIDTVWATVSCDNSADVISRVALIETSPGVYRSAIIPKTEGTGTPNDGVISCREADRIKVVYVDEVYEKPTEDFDRWTVDGRTDLKFTVATDIAVEATFLQDGIANSFGLLVEYPTPSAIAIDTLLVVLTTSDTPADRDTVKVVETGANTGVFVALAPISYVFQLQPGVPGSGRVEAMLNASGAEVVVTGTVIAPGAPITKPLRLLSSFNQVVSAYIKDGNGNGAADSVIMTFSRPLGVLPPPAANTVFWNRTATGNTSIPVLSMLPGSNNVLVYSFAQGEFPVGLSGIPAGERPYVQLPQDNVFGGQQPALADSMGPVIIDARIRPMNPNSLTKLQTDIGMDTLVITLSEKITTKTNFNSLIRFSAASPGGVCPDYSASMPVTPAQSPSRDPGELVYTILVSRDSKSPAKGNCIYLTADGTYLDVPGNLPPKRAVKLDGTAPPPELQVVRAYPPVVGVDAGRSNFTLVNNEKNVEDQYVQPVDNQWGVPWVPPVGFVQGQPYLSPMPVNYGEPLNPGRTDLGSRSAMPPGISTIQVVSNGRYLVDVVIFDHLGNFVRSFRQSFGYFGETFNNDRITNGGLASYIVWDLKDMKGQRAGNGVYVWKKVFTFDNGKQEVRYTRTGNLRNPHAP